MASPKQTQLLAALEAGNKLHDALREPGMPSKKLLEEWLDNPEFEAEYRAAAQKGKEKRERKTGRPEAEEPATAPRPAVLRGQPSPAVQTKARELSKKLTDAIGDGDTYQPAVRANFSNAPDHPLSKVLHEQAEKADDSGAASFTPTELQARVLGALAEGRKPMALLKEIPGYNGVKLAAWRKNPEFARRYDVAKGIGANLGKAAPEAVAPAEPEPDQPKPLVFGAPSNTPALELPDIQFTPQPEAEPAPNQSEPASENTVREKTPIEQWRDLIKEAGYHLSSGELLQSDYTKVFAAPDVAAARHLLKEFLKHNAEQAPGEATDSGGVEREINIPTYRNEAGQTQFGANPAEASRKYQVVKAVREAGWFTLEEAKEKAKELAKKNNKTNWVVERICEVELVAQISY